MGSQILFLIPVGSHGPVWSCSLEEEVLELFVLEELVLLTEETIILQDSELVV